jgi:DNA (cytosine-5)-methyltransferase 1
MPQSYVMKVRGGRDTYVKRDGSVGTAGKGALIGKEVAFTVAATQDQTLMDGTASEYVVRRLTPVECERLQGFSDGYTDIPYKGNEHPPDTPRYKALGNSFAVPVVRWIGERMQMVDEIIEKSK